MKARSEKITRTSLFTLLVVAVGAGFWGADAAAQERAVPQRIAPVDPPFEIEAFERPRFPDSTFDVGDYGARPMEGENSPKNTDAFHRAIDAARKAGGGTVLIPAGDWLTGPIHLQSNVRLHVADGAVVHFSTERADYLPVVRQRHEGVEAYNYSPMIYAYEVENVAITGGGTLDGHGEHWWEWAEEHEGQYGDRTVVTKVPLSRREYGKGAGLEGMRPNFVVFWKSNDILVEGVTLKDTPMWNVHLIYSEQAIVRDVTVSSLRAPNGDGVVLDSSSDILVEYNHFQTGDDAVVLKSGLNEEGLRIGMPTEDIVVRNFEARHVRTGSGGIVFGSETSGGIRNVYVHDAYFEGSDRGIRFKTERGRGNVIEQIFIRDIRMQDIENQAINFNTFYSGPGVTGPAPLIRDVDIRDIQIDGVPEAIVLEGLPEKWLENISLREIEVTNAEEGARIARVKGLEMHEVSITSEARAVEVDDVFELSLRAVSLTDRFEGAPLLIEGEYTGAVSVGGLPPERIEFGDGASEEVLVGPSDQN